MLFGFCVIEMKLFEDSNGLFAFNWDSVLKHNKQLENVEAWNTLEILVFWLRNMGVA